MHSMKYYIFGNALNELLCVIDNKSVSKMSHKTNLVQLVHLEGVNLRNNLIHLALLIYY